MSSTYPLREVFEWVAAAVRQQLVGTPVFALITLFGVARPIDLADAASQLLAAVEKWFDQTPASLRAIGPPDEQLSMMVRYSGGATAIVAVHRAPGSGDGLDFQLIGHHGPISFEGQSGTPRIADLFVACMEEAA